MIEETESTVRVVVISGLERLLGEGGGSGRGGSAEKRLMRALW